MELNVYWLFDTKILVSTKDRNKDGTKQWVNKFSCFNKVYYCYYLNLKSHVENLNLRQRFYILDSKALLQYLLPPAGRGEVTIIS